jgi:hypothetical protein
MVYEVEKSAAHAIVMWVTGSTSRAPRASTFAVLQERAKTMTVFRKLTCLLPLVLTLLAGCSSDPAERVPVPTQADWSELSLALQAMGAEVSPEEADRAARISYEYARALAIQWDVRDPPLVHNTKVNSGRRAGGLCFQYANAIEARLREEGFTTRQFHRGIANGTNILIDHSVVILSAPGEDMFQGIVIDGWRHAGRLFWKPTLEDTRYTWVPREEVFAARRERQSRANR